MENIKKLMGQLLHRNFVYTSHLQIISCRLYGAETRLKV